MVGFTNRGRARHGRGCRLLGKTTKANGTHAILSQEE
jgi:hypothetical protein